MIQIILPLTDQEEEYYLKYQAFELNYDMAENDYSYTEKERVLNMSSISQQLNILNRKLTNTEMLKRAVNNGKNVFSDTTDKKEYYNLFLKYKSDYDSLVTQYNNARKQRLTNQQPLKGLVKFPGIL